MPNTIIAFDNWIFSTIYERFAVVLHQQGWGFLNRHDLEAVSHRQLVFISEVSWRNIFDTKAVLLDLNGFIPQVLLITWL